MKFRRVDRLNVWYAPRPDRRRQVGRLAARRGEVLFEFDREFLQGGLELSPFTLPLARGVIVGDPTRFEGLKGLFDDSLPDGWGRLLIDRIARTAGLQAQSLGPLDRLAIVGGDALGALAYEPVIETARPFAVDLLHLASESRAVLDDSPVDDLECLAAMGSSPQGARPKVLVWLGEDGTLLPRAAPLATAWLVKFPARDEDAHVGALELAYATMAAAAGIEVAPCRLLERTTRRPGFFAARRFDRSGDRRVHVHSLGGLLELPRGYVAFDYRDLIATTRRLTADDRAVREIYRRACFNVLAHNRDDHVRNVAFLMDDLGQWRLSPAFDLTFSAGPRGEHSMLVMGEGHNPTREHLDELAKAGGVKRHGAIVDEVRGAVSRFRTFAEAAGVARRRVSEVSAILGLRRR